MFSALSEWDPLGIADPAEAATSATSKEGANAVLELKQLKQAVAAFLDAAGTQLDAPGPNESAARLGSALGEVCREWQEHKDTVQRELFSMRQTVSMLQSERRQQSTKACAEDKEGVVKLQDALRQAESELAQCRACASSSAVETVASEPDESSQDDALRRARAEGFAAGRETGRGEAAAELNAQAASALAAAHASRDAAERRAAEATSRVDSLQALLAEAHAARHADAAGAVHLQHERREIDAAMRVLCVSLEELESDCRSSAEASRRLVGTTRRRAASMLAQKDAALSRRDALISQLRAHAERSNGVTGVEDTKMSPPKSPKSPVPPITTSETAAVTWAESGATTNQRADDDDNTKACTRREGINGDFDASRHWQTDARNGSGQASSTPAAPGGGVASKAGASLPSCGARSSAEAACAASGDGLASAFSRRIVQLEAELDKTRAQLKANAAERDANAALMRQLKARAARLQRAAAQGGTDPLYTHSVVLNYLTLPPSSRPQLLPVLAAVFGFSEKEFVAVLAAHGLQHGTSAATRMLAVAKASANAANCNVNAANAEANANTNAHGDAAESACVDASAAERGAAPSNSSNAAADAAQTARGPHAAQVAALDEKIRKLRWLLSCANQEIVRLKREAGDSTAMRQQSVT